jgi:farnesyl-diphosphate farnesyltransferase
VTLVAVHAPDYEGVVDSGLPPEDLARLLARTSRTFALAIPILAEPLATDIGLAYLLFRIADTLEDATLWRRDVRLAALESFGAWLREGGGDRAWLDAVAKAPPMDDAGCLELLGRADGVTASLDAQGRDASRVIRGDVGRTAARMASFVSRQTDDGAMSLRDLRDLQDYCYAVAGIVGEMLTSLFVLREPALAAHREELARLAPSFGEGLQLVNILKDAPSDAREGRVYVPRAVPRDEVMALARRDLAEAQAYVALLERAGASKGTLHFCEVPRRLAVATLARLDEGAPKLTRDEVMRIFFDVTSG